MGRLRAYEVVDILLHGFYLRLCDSISECTN